MAACRIVFLIVASLALTSAFPVGSQDEEVSLDDIEFAQRITQAVGDHDPASDHLEDSLSTLDDQEGLEEFVVEDQMESPTVTLSRNTRSCKKKHKGGKKKCR